MSKTVERNTNIATSLLAAASVIHAALSWGSPLARAATAMCGIGLSIMGGELVKSRANKGTDENS